MGGLLGGVQHDAGQALKRAGMVGWQAGAGVGCRVGGDGEKKESAEQQHQRWLVRFGILTMATGDIAETQLLKVPRSDAFCTDSTISIPLNQPQNLNMTNQRLSCAGTRPRKGLVP